MDFYNTYIKGKPVAISIVADPRDVNSKDFAKFGKIVKLSDKDLYPITKWTSRSGGELRP